MAKRTEDESVFHYALQILIMLYVVLVAVLHFAGYMRYFAVWVCGFVNCVLIKPA